jgi:GNAT superfamily N-acetyltransferase
MKNEQSKITDFFRPAGRRPPEHVLREPQSSYLFGPAAERRRLAAQKAYRTRYQSVRKFRRDFHRHYPYDVLLGSVDFLCYCRKEYLFYVVDPATNITVAELEVDSDHWLEHVHVEYGYQRRGLGSRLIHYANQFCLQEGEQEHGMTICVGVSVNTRYRLTEEGAALANACLRKGILQQEQMFYETPPSPGAFY